MWFQPLGNIFIVTIILDSDSKMGSAGGDISAILSPYMTS